MRWVLSGFVVAVAAAAGGWAWSSDPAPDGSQVKAAQAYLAERKLYDGPIDGVLRVGMQDALRRYQRGAGLTVTMRLDDATWARIRADQSAASAVRSAPAMARAQSWSAASSK
jgi:peptidoglycan hydrolase-like protein with peptidoglycan-binding domain